MPLGGIWADSASDAWVVGEHDTVLHWDGKSWTSYPPSTTGCNKDWSGAGRVTGSAPDDVCITCDSKDIHWNGSSFVAEWCTRSNPFWYELLHVDDFTAVSSLSPSEVWAVSDYGDVYRFDGTVRQVVHHVSHSLMPCSPARPRTCRSAAGTSWPTGTAASPTEINLADFGTYVLIESIWASGPDDVWAAAPFPEASGTSLHFDGIQWHKTDLGPNAIYSRIWGTARDDVWVLGTFWSPTYQLRRSRLALLSDGRRTKGRLGARRLGERFTARLGGGHGGHHPLERVTLVDDGSGVEARRHPLGSAPT